MGEEDPQITDSVQQISTSSEKGQHQSPEDLQTNYSTSPEADGSSSSQESSSSVHAPTQGSPKPCSGASTANPSQPEPIEGQVPGGQYHINRFNFDANDIEHGWIKLGDDPFEVLASFLYFEKRDDATNVHRNLLGLKGESFLRSHFVIADAMVVKRPRNTFSTEIVSKNENCFWVAVEKIDKTLEQYKDPEQRPKDPKQRRFSGTRLCSNYQNIIRDIIRGMCEIHQQKYTHGYLRSKHIMIIKDRAKFAYITNGNGNNPATDFLNLKPMFEDVLGNGQHNSNELTHFYEAATTNNLMTLRKLYFHPLLMSPGERFLLPLMADTRLQYRKRGISHQISKFLLLFPVYPKWMDEVTKRQGGYQTVLEDPHCTQVVGGRYQDKNPWHLFKFVRNTIVHINENIRKKNKQRIPEGTPFISEPIQIKTEEDLVKDLSSMFPYFLNKVYELLELREITPSVWMQFLDD